MPGAIIKRAIDIVLSAGAIILIAPLLLAVAIIVRLKLGSPVFFKQQRPGKDARPFTLYKFRTMLDAVDAGGKVLPDEQRMTAFGQFLRSTSMDELPELFNVLKGDMSVVGPRPLMMKYLPRYTPEQARRHEVRPGITGWAQVNGRNALTWEERFKLDVWYVDNRSLWLDMKIVLRTIAMVIKREGITQEGRATMDEFMGTQAKSEGSAGR